jgi:hypothetical protein
MAVVLGGGSLLWGGALREYFSFLEDGRPASGLHTPAPEGRTGQVRLAFLSPDGHYLETETREVQLRPSVAAAARLVLEELRAGSRLGRGSVLPAGMGVSQVFVDQRGVAYVDLSGEFFAAGTEGDPWPAGVRAAQAIAASLGMSLPEIARVQILVEGREVPVVVSGVDLRRPLPASLPLRALDPQP